MRRQPFAQHIGWRRIAFCTILVLAFVGALEPSWAANQTANRDRYRREQVSSGARKIPVLAQLEYRSALDLVAKGEKNQAEDHLRQALRYDPDYSDAYFALARLKFSRFQTDAPVYLIQGVHLLGRTFRSQRILAVNGTSTVAYVLLVLNLVVCIAFSIKYLPYVAHKLTERLQRRFNATAARLVSYLILLSPVALFADTIIPLAYLTLLCWLSMYRREKVLVVFLVAPFIVAGLLDVHVRLAAVLADPKSLTMLVDRANNVGADEQLVQMMEQTPAPGTEAEKNLALGLLYMKEKRYYDASDRLFKALSLRPDQIMGYINLGNVHFLQSDYEKALQGYRKAETIDPTDPICQYNLAQAYIKALLMKEASRSLRLAGTGVEREKSHYAEEAFDAVPVLPKLFSDEDLWRLAIAESKSMGEERAAEGRGLFPWLPRRAGAVIVLVALALAMLLCRLINPEALTFQCSNCGKLTCNACCSDERDMSLCRECAKTIESVSSEKVVEALLRQRRQTALVRRRKSAKLTSMVLPGVRDVGYGHILRGVSIALVFSVSVVYLLTGGSVLRDPTALGTHPPLWRMFAAAAAIIAAYAYSALSKPSSTHTPQRRRSSAGRTAGPVGEAPETTHAA